MIEKPFYTEIDVAFKSLNIKSSNIIESVSSSDEILLFKPEILQAIKFVGEKVSRCKFHYDHFSKTGASNINKNTMYSKISELIEQTKSIRI